MRKTALNTHPCYIGAPEGKRWYMDGSKRHSLANASPKWCCAAFIFGPKEVRKTKTTKAGQRPVVPSAQWPDHMARGRPSNPSNGHLHSNVGSCPRGPRPMRTVREAEDLAPRRWNGGGRGPAHLRPGVVLRELKKPPALHTRRKKCAHCRWRRHRGPTQRKVSHHPAIHPSAV